MALRNMKTPDLSIVIPAYNESKKIGNDICDAAHFLKTHRLIGEIIIVDDGSCDNTAETASSCKIDKDILLRVIRYSKHRGKGYAVRMGMTWTLGKIILFVDSGSCTPYTDILRGIKLINKGKCDIAHASRNLPESVICIPKSLSRRVSSWLFLAGFRKLFPILKELTDTQVGLKIYRGDIGRELYTLSKLDGFLFDIEIILRAAKAGYRICEFPITWSSDPDSRLSLCKMPVSLFRELIILKRNRIV